MDLELQKIVNKSLEIENDFSSSSHAINTIVYESSEEINEEFVIPSRYNKNTMTLLPINTQKHYIYWEIIQETLFHFNLDLSKNKLHFRVEDMAKEILFEFESPFDLGEYFLNLKIENRDICVKVGFIKDNQFIEIMQSNIIHTFSSTVKLPDMSNEIWLEKHRNYIKIIQTNLEHMVFSESSMSYMKQLKKLHYLNNAVASRSSSTALIGRHHD